MFYVRLISFLYFHIVFGDSILFFKILNTVDLRDSKNDDSYISEQEDTREVFENWVLRGKLGCKTKEERRICTIF
jgi:hypothetical protein